MSWVICAALALAGIGVVCVLLDRYQEFPLRPGKWWVAYAHDYAEHFGIPVNEVIKHSAVVEGTNGYIWATDTPEWDQKWFNRRGYQFPGRWIPYEILHGYKGIPGDVVRLDA